MPENFDGEGQRFGFPFHDTRRNGSRAAHRNHANGSRLGIISEEMSISRLTKPGPQMSEGTLRSEWVGATCISIGVVTRQLGGCRVFAQQILETARPCCHVGFLRSG